MSGPRLSPRLETVLSLTPQAQVYADIGADHGYLSIALARRGGRVIAADINSGPLGRAKENIRKAGLEGQIETRLSDGFSAFRRGEIECAVISGIGGELIAEILKKGEKGAKSLVLQPQSSIAELREFLTENGFCILKEGLCREENRFYVAMLVSRGFQPRLTEAEKQIGPCLIRERHPLLGEYLLSRRRELEIALEKMGGSDPRKRRRLEGLIELYNEIEEG